MSFKNVSQFMRGGFIYGLGGVLNGLLPFIALPLIARYISPAEYGVISMLLMMGMFLTALFSLGLGTSIGSSYFSRKHQGERNSVITTAFLILLTSSIVLIVVGLAPCLVLLIVAVINVVFEARFTALGKNLQSELISSAWYFVCIIKFYKKLN